MRAFIRMNGRVLPWILHRSIFLVNKQSRKYSLKFQRAGVGQLGWLTLAPTLLR
jgi:hypothetical protein